ncbi:tetratricopeptide repeat protein [Catellatospora sp. TT07R-123]|uniref:tetratricopeptide repeat protein n=1 Tax=Catellatospora sp. TT07R-123 TaxID=2733863 RepID=UPI001B008EAF|nr:tetratricopeptide repeat protein [Catellatospora sp. TT07R-123]GHJ43144.1 tetratricopeptide repeat protein [Catellatospora sp. TT07R-123]
MTGRRWFKYGLIAVACCVGTATVVWSLVADDKPPVVIVSTAVAALVMAFLPDLVSKVRSADGAGGPPVVGLSSRVVGQVPLAAAHFQTRSREMNALRRAVGGRGRVALVALPGQRGAGKTQLAAALARECDAAGFDLVAWLNAESGPVAGLAQVARARGLGGADDAPEVLAGLAVRWLSDGGRVRRLVVFDNVDDPQALREWLPTRGGVKVVITSNRREFLRMDGVAVVEVGVFTEAQGRAFLRETTGLADGPDAVALGRELGWLPLGLAQAGAYVARNGESYAGYLGLLAGERLDETLRQESGASHPGVLKATMLSMAGVGAADASGDAQRLLGVLSVLSADGVSRRLLVRGEPGLGLSGGVRAALDVLASWSLVTLSGSAGAAGDGVVVVVHRLTARVVRHLASADDAHPHLAEAADTASQLLDVLTDGLPLAQVALRRAEVDELTRHVLAVRENSAGDPPALLLVQADWMGRALEAAGDLTGAVSILSRNLADRRRALGEDHPDTLTSRHNLAVAYRVAGRVAEATALFEQVLADRRRVLGDDHPNTLTSRNNLAVAYQEAGRVAEATALFEQVLADRLRVLGDDHPNTLISRNYLASAYRVAGRVAEATALFEQVLADYRRVLGDDHPNTLTSRNDLAVAYQVAGRVAEATALFEQVLADYRRVLGDDHPDTLISRSNLAGAYQVAGRVAEATALYEQVLADRLRVLGNDHPNTLTSRSNLAGAYRVAGRVAEATALYEQVLADRLRVLGDDHPHTRASRNYLASAYRVAGRVAEATALYEQV